MLGQEAGYQEKRSDQILIDSSLYLRYETTPEQLRFVLAELRKMLLAHQRVAKDPARVRLADFGEHAFRLELWTYARTRNWNEYPSKGFQCGCARNDWNFAAV